MGSKLQELKFYSSDEHPCSYLSGQDANTVFLDPLQPLDLELYSELSRNGFRRSGPHIYKPHCRQCQQCIPVRVLCGGHRLRRSQRRIIRQNQDLKVVFSEDIMQREHYALYVRYIRARHRDGDMYPPSYEQYQSFLDREGDYTRYACFYLEDKLVAVSVFDELDDGTSAIYTFFDPAEERRSLGSYAILWLIQHTKDHGLPHLYLGYWIRDSHKMNYKIQYRPLQLLINQRWVNLN